MTTGLRETSPDLFICKCGSKAFAVGIQPETFQIFGLLCLACGTDYVVDFMEAGDSTISVPAEPTKVLH